MTINTVFAVIGTPLIKYSIIESRQFKDYECFSRTAFANIKDFESYLSANTTIRATIFLTRASIVLIYSYSV